MAFKMNGFSGFINKIRTARAKRLIRKNVSNTTVDSPTYGTKKSDRKFDKSEKKISKAGRLLHKAGYGIGDIEEATGAGGYKAAMDFATNKNKKK